MDSIVSAKGENNGRTRSWVGSFARSISGVEGCAGAPRWGLGRVTSKSIIHMDLHKPNNKLVSTLKATTFPPIIFSMHGHDANTQMAFCLGTPKLGVSKFPKLGLLQLWRPITFFEDLQLK
jgi:hypothetical protein